MKGRSVGRSIEQDSNLPKNQRLDSKAKRSSCKIIRSTKINGSYIPLCMAFLLRSAIYTSSAHRPSPGITPPKGAHSLFSAHTFIGRCVDTIFIIFLSNYFSCYLILPVRSLCPEYLTIFALPAVMLRGGRSLLPSCASKMDIRKMLSEHSST